MTIRENRERGWLGEAYRAATIRRVHGWTVRVQPQDHRLRSDSGIDLWCERPRGIEVVTIDVKWPRIEFGPPGTDAFKLFRSGIITPMRVSSWKAKRERPMYLEMLNGSGAWVARLSTTTEPEWGVTGRDWARGREQAPSYTYEAAKCTYVQTGWSVRAWLEDPETVEWLATPQRDGGGSHLRNAADRHLAGG